MIFALACLNRNHMIHALNLIGMVRKFFSILIIGMNVGGRNLVVEQKVPNANVEWVVFANGRSPVGHKNQGTSFLSMTIVHPLDPFNISVVSIFKFQWVVDASVGFVNTNKEHSIKKERKVLSLILHSINVKVRRILFIKLPKVVGPIFPPFVLIRTVGPVLLSWDNKHREWTSSEKSGNLRITLRLALCVLGKLHVPKMHKELCRVAHSTEIIVKRGITDRVQRHV
mmetsp:Transcript_15578/g.34002  ORF Transcript_15578/g.34002 Transcript_15578/m.34002 type:complete len:227 (+) Transcript_15578:127-807(+)